MRVSQIVINYNRKVRRGFTQRSQKLQIQLFTLCVLCEKLSVLCG